MAISETKMQIVIANYFKDECDVNTSIRQAFEKGFRIGVKKGASVSRQQEWIPCSERLPEDGKYVLAYSADDDYMTVEAKHKFEAFQITHWMPLPKPWKGEEE